MKIELRRKNWCRVESPQLTLTLLCASLVWATKPLSERLSGKRWCNVYVRTKIMESSITVDNVGSIVTAMLIGNQSEPWCYHYYMTIALMHSIFTTKKSFLSLMMHCSIQYRWEGVFLPLQFNGKLSASGKTMHAWRHSEIFSWDQIISVPWYTCGNLSEPQVDNRGQQTVPIQQPRTTLLKECSLAQHACVTCLSVGTSNACLRFPFLHM